MADVILRVKVPTGEAIASLRGLSQQFVALTSGAQRDLARIDGFRQLQSQIVEAGTRLQNLKGQASGVAGDLQAAIGSQKMLEQTRALIAEQEKLAAVEARNAAARQRLFDAGESLSTRNSRGEPVGNLKDFSAAERDAEKANAALARQAAVVQQLRTQLAGAGVDLSKLGVEQQRLAQEAAQIAPLSDRYQQLQREIGQVQRQLDNANASAQRQRAAFNAAGVETGQLVAEEARLRRELEQTANALQLESTRLRERNRIASARQVLDLTPHREVQREIDRTRAAYERLRASGTLTNAELAQAALRVKLRIRELHEEQNGWVNALLGAKTQLAAAAAAFALPVVSVRSATVDQSSLTAVQKLGNLSDQQIRQLDADLRRLSDSTIPLTAAELAKIAQSAGQLNLPVDQYARFVELVGKSASAFDISSEEAGNYYGQLINNFGLTIDEAAAVGDAVNQLADSISNVAERDLLNVESRSAAAAKSFGLTAQQLAALAATMLSTGKAPEVVATGINSLTQKLAAATAQSPEFRQALNGMGLDAQKLAEAIDTDAQGALDLFLGKLAELPKLKQRVAIDQLFGTGEDSQALQVLVQRLDAYRAAVRSATDTQGNAGSVNRAASRDLQDMSKQWQLLLNSLNDITTQIGKGLLPVLTPMVAGLRYGATAVADLAREFPYLASAVTILVSVGIASRAMSTALSIGAVALTQLGVPVPALIAGLRGLIGVQTAVGAAAVASSTRMLAASRLLGVLGGPWGLLITALTTIVGLYALAGEKSVESAKDQAQAAAATGDAVASAAAKIERINAARADASRLEAELLAMRTEYNGRAGTRQLSPDEIDEKYSNQYVPRVGTINTYRAKEAELDKLRQAIEKLAAAPAVAGAPVADKPALPDLSPGAAPAVGLVSGAQRAQLEADRSALEQSLKDAQIDLQAYFAQRQQLIERSFQIEAAQAASDLQQAQQKLASAQKSGQSGEQTLSLQQDLAKANAAVDEARIHRAQANAELQAEIRNSDRTTIQDRQKMEADLLRAQGQDYRASLADLLIEYQQMLDRAGQDAEEADLAGKLFDAKRAQIELQRIEDLINKARDAYERRRDDITSQRQSGAISSDSAARGQQNQNLAEYQRKLADIGRLQQQLAQENPDLFSEEDLKKLQRYFAEADRGLAQIRGPLGDLASEWANSTDNMEQAAVNWANGSIDAITSLVTTGKANFRDLANSIIAELIRIQLQKELSGVLAGFTGFGGFGGTSTTPAPTPSGPGFAAEGGPIPGYAAGGSVGVRAMPAGGDVVGPGTGTSDSVPAYVPAGSYVLRAAAVQRLGRSVIDRIVNGAAPFQSAVRSMKNAVRVQLSNGERVIGPEAARRIGGPLLDAMNGALDLDWSQVGGPLTDPRTGMSLAETAPQTAMRALGYAAGGAVGGMWSGSNSLSDAGARRDSGSPHIVIEGDHIDARGADAGAIAQLMREQDARDDRLIARMADLIRRGKI
ncbi:phage tail tape measure protein [Hydrocarboniphaga sp.]|uniref:phage tail tape measure protein n=1 Tax=Hydrocarboniphaga sp. TaxID=2033016 RepID=UPI003D128733